LRFLSLKTLKRPWLVEDMPVPKRPIRLPEVLSREEVERLIQSAVSPLHRVWLLILYATGVRREELVQLKIGDIDRHRMVIRVRQGKGKKDRNVMLSPWLLQELRDYWRSANPKPKTYLFPSKSTHPNGDLPMTSKRHMGFRHLSRFRETPADPACGIFFRRTARKTAGAL
jgi:integrase/recombinase XerD